MKLLKGEGESSTIRLNDEFMLPQNIEIASFYFVIFLYKYFCMNVFYRRWFSKYVTKMAENGKKWLKMTKNDLFGSKKT